jgi:UDP-N-acetylglucosamine 2-epimerase
MTGEMLGLLEELLTELKPDLVLVYGDTNTTLAGGLSAAKLNIPVAHVEAGLRSFNRTMPEEINRVLVDHLSTWLFCPTQTAVDNLAAEGIGGTRAAETPPSARRTGGVRLVGDVMLDTALFFAERVDAAEVAARCGVEPGAFYLATLHRQAASDDPGQLGSVVRAFARLDAPVLWAVHPRTRKNLERFGLEGDLAAAAHVRVLDPLPYLETNGLLRSAKALLTDSGGMQKEAYFFGVPCVTMREETEWVETVELGWNVLTGTDEERIVAAASSPPVGIDRLPVYGDGHAAEKIADILGARR